MTDEERWMSVEDIAAHLGVRSTTVYKWIEGRAMPAHRVGKLWMLKRSEVDQWVRANQPGPGTTFLGTHLVHDSLPSVLHESDPGQPVCCRSQEPGPDDSPAPRRISHSVRALNAPPPVRSARSLFDADAPVASDRPEVGRVVGLAAVGRSGRAVPVSIVAARGQGRVVPMGGAPLFLAESTRAATRCLRRVHESLGLSREWLASFDLGVMSDATDLPDQGLALAAAVAAALVSALTGRPVRPGLAMFGSLSEEGRIEPADRARERLRAARSAGIRQVLLPAANAGELDGGTTARAVETIPVGTLTELLERALLQRDSAGLDLV
ncbi:MAG: S16 family serine protease [bacterium]